MGEGSRPFVSIEFFVRSDRYPMLEAAITNPIAILVMLAIVNLGMVIHALQAVQAAVRQGARMGSAAQHCLARSVVSAAKSSTSATGFGFGPRRNGREHSQKPGVVL